MMPQMLTPVPNQPGVLACTCNLSTQQVKAKRSVQDILRYTESSNTAQDTWDRVSAKQKAEGVDGGGKRKGNKKRRRRRMEGSSQRSLFYRLLFVSYLNTLLLLLLVWRGYSTDTASIIPNHWNATKCLFVASSRSLLSQVRWHTFNPIALEAEEWSSVNSVQAWTIQEDCLKRLPQNSKETKDLRRPQLCVWRVTFQTLSGHQQPQMIQNLGG